MKPRIDASQTRALSSWEEGLYLASEKSLEAGAFSSLYLKDIVNAVHAYGETMAITKGTVCFHAQESCYVHAPFICYMYVQKPVHYFGKHIHHIFVMGALNNHDHRKMLALISAFTMARNSSPPLNASSKARTWLINHMDTYLK